LTRPAAGEQFVGSVRGPTRQAVQIASLLVNRSSFEVDLCDEPYGFRLGVDAKRDIVDPVNRTTG